MYTGPQLKPFLAAFQKAFDPASLRVFMYTVMDRRLHDVAMGEDFREIVFKLLDKANQQGWIDDLLKNAAAEVPGNQELQAAAATARLAVPPTPLMPVAPPDARALEKIVDQHSRFEDVDKFLDRFQRIRNAVCRVEVPGAGGTGFLVAPDLVITNYHVIEGILSHGALSAPVNCVFGHRRDAGTGLIAAGETFAVDPAWRPVYRKYSRGDTVNPPRQPAADELDYAILRLQERAASRTVDGAPAGERGYFELATAVDLPPDGQPVFILQHPQPGAGQPQMPLQVAVGKTLPCAWPELRLRYNASTLHGSSGSPCFNSDLELSGLHHTGDPATNLSLFNQGVPLRAVAADLASPAQQGELAARHVPAFRA